MSTLSKNMSWSILTSLLQLYTGSIVFIVLAKLMNLHDFGILSFGFSLAALVAVAADFGFSLMIIKDFPEVKNSKKGSYLSNSLIAKLVLSVIGAILFFIYLYLFYNADWLKVGIIYVAIAVTTSFVTYFQALLRVENQFKAYSQSVVVYAIVITFCILLYWIMEMNLIQLVIGLGLCRAVQLLYVVHISKIRSLSLFVSLNEVKRLLKNSWSFGLHMLLGIFYFMVDTQIISVYYDASEVALYQSVFRIILILLLCSDIISNVLLPYLSYKYYRKENVTKIVSKISLFLLIIGCSLFLLFTTFKLEILNLLYTSEYNSAVVLVLPFSIVLVLRTVSSLMGTMLTISNRQKYRVFTVSVSLIVSLTLNLYFIPIYGILSAAWISVVVHLVLFSMYYYYTKLIVSDFLLFNTINLVVIGSTAVIYLIIHTGLLSPFLAIPLGIMAWIILVTVVMRKQGNFLFLKQMLNEKGSG